MLPELHDIIAKRRALGITQKDLAVMSQVSQSFIAKMESNKISPSYQNVKKIYEVLNSKEKQVKEEIMAKELYHKNVISVKPESKISEAVKTMKKYNISQLPVFKNNNVVGSIFEKNIVAKISSGLTFKDLSKMRVEDVMSDPFPRIQENTPVKIISSLLQYNQAVLLTRQDRVIGIITKSDLIKMIK